MSYSLPDLMQLITDEQGEAVHLHDREAPTLEIHGGLHRIEGPALEPGDTQTLLQSLAPAGEFREAIRTGLCAFEHKHDEFTVFRIMTFREEGSLRLELRRLASSAG